MTKEKPRKLGCSKGCFIMLLLFALSCFVAMHMLNRSLNDFGDDFLNAAHQGSLAKIRALLEAGKDPNQKDRYGNNPMTLAAYEGHCDILELLIEHGGDVHILDKMNMTPLHCAVYNNHFEATRLLLNHDVLVDAEDKYGQSTPLEIAVSVGSPEITALLLDHGASVNHKDARGWQPLHMTLRSNQVSHKNRIKIVRLLLANGADPNADNPGGWEDDSNHDSEVFPSFERELLNHGNTPKAIAQSNGFDEILDILNQHVAQTEKTPGPQ